MPKGNPYAYKNVKNNMMTEKPDITEAENEAMILNALDVFHTEPPDLKDPAQVEDAIDGYFRSCIERGVRPGNMGLYAALGLSRQEVSNELRGMTHKLGSSTVDVLKKACVAMSMYRESLGSSGKLNPVTLIFWQKNYDGLKDQQDVVITPNASNEPDLTMDQIESDIPIDID